VEVKRQALLRRHIEVVAAGHALEGRNHEVGAPDAEYLEEEFMPEFTPQDVVNLPNYHIYLKLMVDGVTSRPFSAVTLPPLKFEADPDVAERIIRVSRERYARPRAEVEEQISSWSGMFAGDVEGRAEPAAKPKPTLEDQKLYQSPCGNCGKPAYTPVKPDSRRPVYCMDCIKKFGSVKALLGKTGAPTAEPVPVGRGQPRFSATLGALGIEFAEESRPTVSGSLVRGGVGAPRTIRGGGEDRRHGLRERHDWPGRRMNHAEPAIRFPHGVTPISLAELRAEREAAGQANRTREAGRPAVAPRRRSPDLAALRKALAESMAGRDGERHAASEPRQPPPADDTPQVIQPGETIRFQ
jgi:CxxC-x17-CxxC domain-containing protein